MLPLRIVSAAVGIPVIFLAVFFGGIWYAVFLWLVAILGIREFFFLFKKPGDKFIYAGYLGVSALLLSVYLQRAELVLGVLMFYFLAASIVLLWRFERVSLEESSLALWGIIYVGGLLGYLLAIRNLPEGFIFTLILFVAIWLNDSTAYICGVRWGKKKLAAHISPKKSVEGALAGAVATLSVFVSLALFRGDLLPLNFYESLGLILLIIFFAQTGDLVESALKRKLNVKDSGGLIPGHGGILDRFDSVMFAAPFVYYYLLVWL